MTYVLITGALIVWGLIFYKIVAGLGSDEVISTVNTQRRSSSQVAPEEDKGFILLSNYRDPFLGHTTRPVSSGDGIANNSRGIIKNKKTVPKKEAVVIDWSFVKYIGIVNNKETKKKVGLVIINGTEYMVNENDVICEVAILKKERDSILVEFKENKKWIRR
jgi:hypothetical protein